MHDDVISISQITARLIFKRGRQPFDKINNPSRRD